MLIKYKGLTVELIWGINLKETITLLHTNDLHGHYDFAIRQAALIKKEKWNFRIKVNMSL